MCARFIQTVTARELQRFLALDVPDSLAPQMVAVPQRDVLAVVEDAGGRRARSLRWGLVPSWADDAAFGQRLFNARAETAAEKPAFRQAIRTRRCALPATEFLEWAHPGAPAYAEEVPAHDLFGDPVPAKRGKPQPFAFGLDDGAPFALAGLWERWERDGAVLETCTVLTTAPNALVAEVHDRMPCMMNLSGVGAWIDSRRTDPGDLRSFLAPFPAERMRRRPMTAGEARTR